ncbi:hypothetical protein Tco_0241349 [Tanacetum coccineum]
MIEEESTKSEAESWGRDEDDNNNDRDSISEGKEVEDDEEEKEDESIKTPTNYSSTDDEDEINIESKVEDKAEGDKDKGIDYTTNQFDDDVDQGNENLEITLNQVIEDAHVTISTIAKKTEVLVTSSSHSSDVASKFLKFSDIPHTDAKIISPMDVHVHHEVPSNQTPILLTVLVSVITESSPIYTTVITQSLPSFTLPPPKSTPIPPPPTEATNPPSALLNFASVFQFNNRVLAFEKEVAELKKDDLLNTQVTALVDEHLDSRLEATRDEFMSYLSASITARITDMVTESLEHAVLAKESSQLKSTYEAAASLIEFVLKKILIDKMDESQSYLTATEQRECYDGLIKSYDLYKSLFSTYDKKRKTSKDAEPTKGPKTKESKFGSSKGTKSQSKSFGKSVQAEEPEFEVADSDMPQDQEENLGNDDEEPKGKVASKRDWFTKPKKPQEPTDPDWNLEYDFEECYKALLEKLEWDNPEGGDYPFDLTKPLPLVMNGNRQIVPVDYFFNNDLKYMQGGISTMIYTTSIMKAKAAQYDLPGIEDMVPNIWMTRVEVMQKHGYRYLREIEVRRTDNELHIFKEGDFPRLRINDIEDMLILVVQNRLTNLSGNDMGVKNYQKKINVTKPETARPDIRKRDPYTPYQDPQGFIYVDNQGRNRLMRSDELYKFSDGTLTRL